MQRISRRGSMLLLAIVVVVVVALVATAILVFAPRSPLSMRSIQYQTDTGAISNPERGWYDRLDTIVTARNFTSTTKDGLTLLHSYVQLDDFRYSPIDQATLDGLQQGLNAVRAAGLKIVLRFAYNQGPSSADGGADASESMIKEHLAQLTPILQKNADVIASVEAGFIGQWGEWHDSTDGLINTASEKSILSAILKAVPASRDVELRYPADYRSLEGTPLSSSAANGSDKSRIGNHQDCFLSSSPDDTGTFDRDGHSAAVDKALVAKIGRYAFVGGETCNSTPPARTNCTTALKELAQMHFTYLNRDFEPNSLAKLKKEGCYDTIGNRLGYRLSINSASLPVQLTVGQAIPFSVSLSNTGFASPINRRPVYLVLSNHSRTESIPLSAVDPRDWDPGTKIRIAETHLALTTPLPAGTYSVSLWLPDASSSLRDKPAYAIHLASVGVWNARTGYNKLGTVIIKAG
jgi:Domain of unknown function (DUF4832)/Domain of unknown function (DUF4874)